MFRNAIAQPAPARCSSRVWVFQTIVLQRKRSRCIYVCIACYRLWRAEHPEFEQIVFHGLRHSSATYQLLQSDGDFKSVQGNTGHATASVLMDTYAHTQDKPRLELTEKIEANFYSQDLTPAAPQPQQNEKPVATKITGKEILEAIRLMDADERRELTRALFA